MPKWLWGIIFISVSMVSIRDTANRLASTPEAVATSASATVSRNPQGPSVGSAARASA